MILRPSLMASVASAALLALLQPAVSGSAEAGSVSNGNKNSVTLSGQVNRAVLFADDGRDSEVFQVDNDASSSRFRIVAKGAVNESVSAGAMIEAQIESNSTASITIDDSIVGGAGDRGVGTGSFGERHVVAYFEHKQFGRLSLGQTDTASNGTSEIDLSGTAMAGYSDISTFSGAVKFRNEATGVFTAKTPGTVFSNMDGLSRDDILRYDTPTFGGFKLSASHVAGGAVDVAARYAGKFDGHRISAGVAFADNSSISTTVDSQINGSISIRHDSGLNGTVAAGVRDQKGAARDDATFWYAKLGYAANLNSLGPSSFSLDYMQADDIAANGDDAETFGVQAVQSIAAAGTEIYVGFRHHALDNATTNFEDIFSVLAGARIKF